MLSSRRTFGDAIAEDCTQRFHSTYSGSLHNDELRLQLVKAQTTSERQANHSIELTV